MSKTNKTAAEILAELQAQEEEANRKHLEAQNALKEMKMKLEAEKLANVPKVLTILGVASLTEAISQIKQYQRKQNAGTGNINQQGNKIDPAVRTGVETMLKAGKQASEIVDAFPGQISTGTIHNIKKSLGLVKERTSTVNPPVANSTATVDTPATVS